MSMVLWRYFWPPQTGHWPQMLQGPQTQSCVDELRLRTESGKGSKREPRAEPFHIISSRCSSLKAQILASVGCTVLRIASHGSQEGLCIYSRLPCNTNVELGSSEAQPPVSSNASTQGFPPPIGACFTERIRLRCPPPQLTVQCPHSWPMVYRSQ